MRVVMPVAIPEVLRFRERTGADRFDEMWQGVLHMRASPSFRHQSHAARILNFFVEVWCPRAGGAAVMQLNVSTPERWDQDYRAHRCRGANRLHRQRVDAPAPPPWRARDRQSDLTAPRRNFSLPRQPRQARFGSRFPKGRSDGQALGAVTCPSVSCQTRKARTASTASGITH
jgi:hypothetical protein